METAKPSPADATFLTEAVQTSGSLAADPAADLALALISTKRTSQVALSMESYFLDLLHDSSLLKPLRVTLGVCVLDARAMQSMNPLTPYDLRPTGLAHGCAWSVTLV